MRCSYEVSEAPLAWEGGGERIMGTQFTCTLPSAENETITRFAYDSQVPESQAITRCNAGSRPDVAVDPRTYVMPSNPYAVAAVGAAIMPTVLAVHPATNTSVMMTPATPTPAAPHAPVPPNARPNRAVGTTVKKHPARAPLNAHFSRVGMVSMIILLGALLGAVLGLAVAPARAQAEGAHRASAPVRQTTKPVQAPTEAEPATAAEPPSAPATTKTSLAPSPLRAKARPVTTPKKSAKRAAPAAGLLGAGLGL